jgi:hypothetical protein
MARSGTSHFGLRASRKAHDELPFGLERNAAPSERPVNAAAWSALLAMLLVSSGRTSSSPEDGARRRPADLASRPAD